MLILSASATNNDHLQSIEHNCCDEDVCVEYTGNTALQTRKLCDDDVRPLASVEGSLYNNNNKPTNQPTKQSSNLSVSQPTKQTTKQLDSQPTNQPTN